MRDPSFHIILAIACIFAGCSERSRTDGASSTEQARTAIISVLDSLATAISNRDAAAVVSYMSTDSSIAYVSDGRAIRGTELQSVLAKVYATMRSITFRWDSLSLAPLGNQTWIATGWADISLTDSTGHVEKSRAIFTWTAIHAGNRWKLAFAHKTTLK